MAGLSGCWSAESPDAAWSMLETLTAAVAHRGSVVRVAAPSGGLVMSIVHDAADTDDVPGFYESGDVVVTFDGFLSDRPAMAASLGLPAQTPSAHIMAAMIRSHGAERLEQLTGHFACAIWWHAKQRVLLARDALGVRPLFTARCDGRLAWSSSLKAVAAAVMRTSDIDDEFMADYLSRQHQSPRTPFKGVSSVESGSVVHISSTKHRVCRVWTVGEPDRSAACTDPAEYRERLCGAVAAVADETSGRIFAELSGGVDSSSIVCIADHLHSAGRLRCRVDTISHRYDQSPSSDELPWITAVEQHRGSAGHHLKESNGWLFEEFERAADDDQPSPTLCFGGLARQRHAVVRAHPGAVLISGMGGDQVTLGDRQEALELTDLLRVGDVRATLAVLPAWTRALRRSAPSLLAEALGLLVNPRLTWRISRRARRAMPPWLHAPFVRRHDLGRRVAERSWPGGRKLTPAARYRLALIRDAANAASWTETRCGKNYIDIRYPFLDPRLVVWALSIPFGAMTRPDQERALVRRELKDVLPDNIWRRRGKRGPDEALLRAVEARWTALSDLIDRAEVVKRGYVDGPTLTQSLTKARHGAEPHLFWLVKTLGLEIWLRGLRSTRPRELNNSLRHDFQRARLSFQNERR